MNNLLNHQKNQKKMRMKTPEKKWLLRINKIRSFKAKNSKFSTETFSRIKIQAIELSTLFFFIKNFFITLA
jgi:hypothetical protein